MNFNLAELKDLLLCTRDHNLQSVSIKEKNFELIINKSAVKFNNNYTNLQLNDEVPKGIKNTQKKFKRTNPKRIEMGQGKHEKTKDSDIYFTIVSPMVGTFYRSPAPNESPFIKINDNVKVNQTVCIIEAMKLMNEIETEVSGQVVEILAKDGDIIDCGQALMKIKPEE